MVKSSKIIPTHEGEYGDHPLGGAVGGAVGAAAGAAIAGAAQGAAVGTAAGLPGMAAGVAIGGVVGALAGKGIAQDVNPTTEDAYWADNFRDRDYIPEDATYDTYRPAYRYGVDAFGKHAGRSFAEVEDDLGSDWERVDSELSWEEAKPAARDAFNRLEDNTGVNTRK